MVTNVLPRSRGSHFASGIWRVADPKITLASVASMIVGASAAAWAGPISWGWLAATVIGIFCVEAAKNASGEVFDWDSGADSGLRDDERSPFSGGKRVIVDGLLTRAETGLVAAGFYLVAIVVGLAIVLGREHAVLYLGMLGVGLAFFYHAPPFRLAYRGLGELAVATAYGPVIAVGTYLVQRNTIDAPVLLASIPLGIAIGAFLWINEFPDARADAAAGKRTLVVRLGRPRAARVYGVIVAAAYAAVFMLPFFGLPAATWLGLVGAPLSISAAKILLANPETPREIVPAQAQTLLAFVVMAAGVGAGFITAAIWS
jgi:1,4-dihydroxy-2-naphthoate octaprenyltransferase